MSNPVLSLSSLGAKPAQPVGFNTPQFNNNVAVSALEQQFQAPSATAIHTERMTVDDVVMRSGFLVAIIVGIAFLQMTIFQGNDLLTFAGLGAGIILGLVNSFKRTPSAILIIAYAAAEGFALGGISFMFNTIYQGIVMQAIIGTLGVFAASVFLFSFAGVRASRKWTKIFLLALLGMVIFSGVNALYMLTSHSDTMWGLNTSVTIAGIPLGLLIGVFCIGLAAFSFIIDLTLIEEAVKNGAPRIYAWRAAFGLCVTLVWLYTEVLRVLAILNSRS